MHPHSTLFMSLIWYSWYLLAYMFFSLFCIENEYIFILHKFSPFLEIYWPYCKNTSPSYKDISWNFNFVAGFKFKIQHWLAVENIQPFCIWNYLQYIAYNTYLIAIIDSTIIIKMILPVYYTLPLNKIFYYISLENSLGNDCLNSSIILLCGLASSHWICTQ